MKNILIISCFVLGSGIFYSGCAGKLSPTPTPTDATSVSELATALVAGAVNATSSSGTMAMRQNDKSFFARARKTITLLDEAYASPPGSLGTCATFQAGPLGTGCAVAGTSIETLIFNNCNFGNSTALWTGSQIFTLTTGSTALTCGPFPGFVSGDVLVRTFGPTTYRALSPTDAVPLNLGLLIFLDTSSSITGWKTPTAASGESITFTGGGARNITITGVHLSGSKASFVLYDDTISSPAFTVTAGNAVASATVTTQLNKTLEVATSTFSALTFSAGCCFPTGGTVTTVFDKSTSPSETLAFSATCGTATLNGTNITLNHCF